MTKISRIACLLLFILSVSVKGQTEQFEDNKGEIYTIDKREEVLIQSWKKGTETIINQPIKFDLALKSKDFKYEIFGDSGKRYVLKFFRNPNFNLDLEHWEVQMFEAGTNKRKTKLSENLLSPEKYGALGQEALIGVFYPEEAPFVFSSENKVLWGEGSGYYYFKTARKINIENFCVSLRIGDYKFKEKKKTKLETFELIIDFASPCQ